MKSCFRSNWPKTRTGDKCRQWKGKGNGQAERKRLGGRLFGALFPICFANSRFKFIAILLITTNTKKNLFAKHGYSKKISPQKNIRGFPHFLFFVKRWSRHFCGFPRRIYERKPGNESYLAHKCVHRCPSTVLRFLTAASISPSCVNRTSQMKWFNSRWSDW